MKNNIVNSLFDNRGYIYSSLIDLIREESKRIVNASLANKNDVDGIVNPFIAKAISLESLDDKLLALSKMHSALNEIKLPYDFNNFYKAVVAEITTNNNVINEAIPAETHETCCDSCATGIKCCSTQSNEQAQIQAEEIFSKLEKLAYTSGLNGKHEVAYIIEKFIKYNK